MEHTYQDTMLMPAAYAVLSEEEMTYVDGGAFSIQITPEQAAAFAINLAVNVTLILGQGAFQYAVSGIRNGVADGLGIVGTLDHFWGKLSPWSKVATVGLGLAGGLYVYNQVVGIVNSIKNLIDAIQSPSQQAQPEQQLLAA